MWQSRIKSLILWIYFESILATLVELGFWYDSPRVVQTQVTKFKVLQGSLKLDSASLNS